MQKGSAPILILVGILVIIGIAGGAYYFGKSQAPKLQDSVVTSQTQQQTIAPQVTPDETANWKTYTDSTVSFRYPQGWDSSLGDVMTSSDPRVRLVVVAKDQTLMNECMQLMFEEMKNSLTIKKFARVATGAMCEGADPNLREIWVSPSKDVYSPGVSYAYIATESKQAEEIFDQILSTFKFTQ